MSGGGESRILSADEFLAEGIKLKFSIDRHAQGHFNSRMWCRVNALVVVAIALSRYSKEMSHVYG